MRVFKTRSLATEACKGGKVLVDGQPTKPSKEILEGMEVTVRKPPAIYTYRIKGLLSKRVSAKLVPEYLEDLTNIEEINKLKFTENFFIKRDRGSGRPTKKERRLLDNIQQKRNRGY